MNFPCPFSLYKIWPLEHLKLEMWLTLYFYWTSLFQVITRKDFPIESWLNPVKNTTLKPSASPHHTQNDPCSDPGSEMLSCLGQPMLSLPLAAHLCSLTSSTETTLAPGSGALQAGFLS